MQNSAYIRHKDMKRGQYEHKLLKSKFIKIIHELNR